MSDIYSTHKKTKMVSLRIEPEDHKKLVEMTAQYNECNRSYWGNKTVSKMICAALDDFINGNQNQRKKFDEVVKKKKKR